jgi:hypothetical protein
VNRLRLGFALLGMALALLSVSFNDRRLAWVAIALLTVSLVLRLILRKREKASRERES